MKTKLLLLLALIGSFMLGVAFSNINLKQKKSEPMKRVTGIGGIFFKCKNPKLVREWYQKHLGLNTNEYGAVFEWYQGADSTQKGFSQWSPFNEKTKYFEPSIKEFMINYRVKNLKSMVELLKQEGVTILDTIETYEYGKFIHIIDIEGNKIELWEPNDVAFEKIGKNIGAVTVK